MRIITDQKKINRNSRIGYWASMFSPMVLMVSAVTLFQNPNAILQALTLLLIGSFGYTIGMNYRRYGRGTDMVFNSVLKRLGNEYTIYHFITPVNHLLVGPAGIWILVPKFNRGIVNYNEKRKQWRLTRDSVLRKVFFFMGEGLGNPKRDILSQADSLDRYLTKRWTLEENPHVQAALVMIHPETKVDADNAPIPTMHATELRAFIREQENSSRVPNAVLREFNQLFEEKAKEIEEAEAGDTGSKKR